MSTVAEPALENANAAPVADVLPEKAKVSLPVVKADYGAGEFWKDESVAEKKAVAPAMVEKPAAAEPTVKPGPTLAEKLAARNAAPKVKAEGAPPAPAAATPVVAADNPEDKLALDPKSSPKARENFENLRHISRDLRSKVSAYEKELTELRAKAAAPAAVAGVDTAEIERIRAEHKAMSDKLLLIDTKNHPAFQAQYVKPRNEALAAAQELLKANGKDADLAALIERPRGEIGKALQEMLKDLPPLDQTEISQGVASAFKLRQAEQAALANAGQVNGAIKQNDVQTHVQAFEKTWSKLAPVANEMLEPVEIPATATPEARRGIEEYNTQISRLQENARQMATGAATYESIAEASIKAATYDLHTKYVLPRIGAEVNAMLDIIKAQKTELDGYKSRNPNREIRANAGPEGGAAPAKSKTIEEAADEAFG